MYGGQQVQACELCEAAEVQPVVLIVPQLVHANAMLKLLMFLHSRYHADLITEWHTRWETNIPSTVTHG